MFTLKSKLKKALAEIARLRELLARTEGERDSFREMAGRAIGLLNEPRAIEIEKSFGGQEIRRVWFDSDLVYSADHLPNYQAPVEKHCPECCVSVRAESWPVECPNCHCMFGFEESE